MIFSLYGRCERTYYRVLRNVFLRAQMDRQSETQPGLLGSNDIVDQDDQLWK